MTSGARPADPLPDREDEKSKTPRGTTPLHVGGVPLPTCAQRPVSWGYGPVYSPDLRTGFRGAAREGFSIGPDRRLPALGGFSVDPKDNLLFSVDA